MNSKERHEARYQRRKLNRERKRAIYSETHSDKGSVFGIYAIANAYVKTRKASRWKSATQAYGANLFINAAKESAELISGEWKPKRQNKFVLYERGHRRNVTSVQIGEKCVQRAFCDNCLVPILRRPLIYDNGASLEGKGADFALNRFKKHLRDHIRKYGRTGGILFFDFSDYFNSICHDILSENLFRYVQDELMKRTYSKFLHASGEYRNGAKRGLGLGSQVFQISAVFFPNAIDHWIKDGLGINGYGRYMDDGYIISDSIEQLKEIRKELENKAEALGLKLSKKKCKIIRIEKPFSFLKSRFGVDESGRVIHRMWKESAPRMRKKIRKFRAFVDCGRMTFEEVNGIFHAWIMGLRRGKNFRARVNAIKYFDTIFEREGGYKILNPRKRKYRELRAAVAAARRLP